MAGFKDFADGNVLFASELDGYLMRQTVMRFGSTVALTNALTAGIRETGMIAWADSTGIGYLFDGTNWIPWFSPEKSFNPVFTAGGTNITFGNAVFGGWYRYVGGMVRWNWRMVVGSTSNLGVGNWAWSMPVSTRSELDQHYMGGVSLLDASTTTSFHRGALTFGTTSSIGAVAEAGQRMGAAAPVAWAQNDVIGISLEYPPSTGTYL